LTVRTRTYMPSTRLILRRPIPAYKLPAIVAFTFVAFYGAVSGKLRFSFVLSEFGLRLS